MATLREQLDKAAAEHAKPVKFVFTTLDGAEVFIHPMTVRQMREWWAFEYAEVGKATRGIDVYDKLQKELFARLCVDENDARLFGSAEDVNTFCEKPGAGRAVEEFYQEARRFNCLFDTPAGMERERAKYFKRKLTIKNPLEQFLRAMAFNRGEFNLDALLDGLSPKDMQDWLAWQNEQPDLCAKLDEMATQFKRLVNKLG